METLYVFKNSEGRYITLANRDDGAARYNIKYNIKVTKALSAALVTTDAILIADIMAELKTLQPMSTACIQPYDGEDFKLYTIQLEPVPNDKLVDINSYIELKEKLSKNISL